MRSEVIPRIDADLLVYQVAFAQQKKNEQGVLEVNSFDSCVDLLETIVGQICQEVWATEKPIFYLTGGEQLTRSLAKTSKSLGYDPKPYVENFRVKLAKTVPYKSNRPEKPYHYNNLNMYIANMYDTKVSSGMEADDILAIDHLATPDGLTSVLCSRDKDLMMIPGKHYSWPCYKSEGKRSTVTELGELLEPDRGKGINGSGLKFFYAQCLTGDRTDTIPGLAGYGPVSAYKLLKDAETEFDCFKLVTEEYTKNQKSLDYFMEQANLLWIIRKLDESGRPVLYVPPS